MYENLREGLSPSSLITGQLAAALPKLPTFRGVPLQVSDIA